MILHFRIYDNRMINMIRYRSEGGEKRGKGNTRIKLQKPCIKEETNVTKLSRMDKCYEKELR